MCRFALDYCWLVSWYCWSCSFVHSNSSTINNLVTAKQSFTAYRIRCSRTLFSFLVVTESWWMFLRSRCRLQLFFVRLLSRNSLNVYAIAFWSDHLSFLFLTGLCEHVHDKLSSSNGRRSQSWINVLLYHSLKCIVFIPLSSFSFDID